MEMAAAIQSAKAHLEMCQSGLENWGLDDEAGYLAQAMEGIAYAIESLGILPEGWAPPAGGAPLGEGSIVAPNDTARAYFGAALEGVEDCEVIGHPSPAVYLVTPTNGSQKGLNFLIVREQFSIKKRVRPAPAPTAQMDLEEEIAARQHFPQESEIAAA